MSQSYFDTVTTVSAYKRVAEQTRLAQPLPASSSWGRKELVRCRVIIESCIEATLKVPGLLSPPTERQMAKGPSKSQILDFIHGLAERHRDMSEVQMVHDPEIGPSLAQIWSALENVFSSNSVSTPPPGRYPPRNRVATQNYEHYVDSTELSLSSPLQASQQTPSSSQSCSSPLRAAGRTPSSGQPLSSPLQAAGQPLSSPLRAAGQSSPLSHIPSSSAGSVGYVERRAPECLVSEDHTVSLGLSVIRHVLWYVQSSEQPTSVQIRQPQRQDFMYGMRKVVAIDDGGLCLRDADGSRTMKSVVLVEAKKQLDMSGDYPTVSDQLLGQLTCEAIAARMAGKEEDPKGNVFVIHLAQHYMRFFHFKISDRQLDQISGGKTPETPIWINTTRLLDIKVSDDRKYIVRNLYSLVEYMKGLGQ